MPVLMLWVLSYTTDGTMLAYVTTYRYPTFHMNLCVLLGWKAPKVSGGLWICVWILKL